LPSGEQIAVEILDPLPDVRLNGGRLRGILLADFRPWSGRWSLLRCPSMRGESQNCAARDCGRNPRPCTATGLLHDSTSMKKD
jgi:hypothetical protein